MYREMIYFLSRFIWLGVFYYNNAIASEGFGEIAANIYEPISLIIHLVKSVSIICGAGLLLGGILKFIEYRRNPVAVRLSTVVFMFIFGGALIIVSLIPLVVKG